MAAFALGIFGVAYILLFAEILKTAKVVKRTESLRKFVHTFTGLFAASWAFFMPLQNIQLIAMLLLVVVLVSKRLSIFKSVHNVSRITYGEEMFAIGILFSATLAGSDWAYAAAVLHLGLADGLAGIVGAGHDKQFRYKIWGQVKSTIGSATFYIVSLAITATVLAFAPVNSPQMALVTLVWLPIAATLVESISVYGTDNLLVPALVVIAFNTLY